MAAAGDTIYHQFTTKAIDKSLADADITPTGTLVRNGSDTEITVTITNKDTGVYVAQFTIPATYVAGDEVALRIAATIGGVATGTVVWQKSLANGAGAGAIEVDHDYGGADNLRYVTSSGSGIGGAVVRAYLTSEYNQGNRSQSYIVAVVSTSVDGRWAQSMMLEASAYTLVYYKSGAFGPDVKQVTVSE